MNSESNSPVEDLIATIRAVVRLGYFLISWLYAGIRLLVAIFTIRVPLLLLSILEFSFTMSLNFTAIATLTIILITTLSYFWKVRYLNRYSTLKEAALPVDEGFDLQVNFFSLFNQSKSQCFLLPL